MNLVSETKQRLNFINAKLIDLQECLELGSLTKDCRHYLQDEISKTKKNIKYYSELLEVLEKAKEDEK